MAKESAEERIEGMKKILNELITRATDAQMKAQVAVNETAKRLETIDQVESTGKANVKKAQAESQAAMEEAVAINAKKEEAAQAAAKKAELAAKNKEREKNLARLRAKISQKTNKRTMQKPTTTGRRWRPDSRRRTFVCLHSSTK